MHYARTLVSWALFVGCVSAVGGCVFLFVRHRPRCTIVGPLAKVHLSSDGSRLVTLRTMPSHDKHIPKQPGVTLSYCPLQVWDTHSGRVVHEWFRDEKVLRHVCSPDDRHVAVDLGDGVPRLVDCRTGQDWVFDEIREVANRFLFSPKGRWLFVGTSGDRPNYLIDVAAHRIALSVDDYWITFSSDDKLLYVRKGPKSNLTVWDLDAGKALGVVATTSPHYEVSADGRLLVERHSEPIPEPIEPEIEPGTVRMGGGFRKIERKDYRVDLWDLTTFRHRSHHKLPRAGIMEVRLSPDGRRLAMWLRGDKQGSNLEMVDTATGRRLWTYAMKDGHSCDFSSDGALCAFLHGEPKATMTMIDAVTGRVLWERAGWSTTYFVRGTRILLHQDDDTAPVLFLDAATGEQKATVPLTFTTANCIPMLTPNGRHFAICGWDKRNRPAHFWEAWLEKGWPEIFGDGFEGVMVMESATGRELLRVLKRDGHSNQLSADASTLITIEPLGEPATVFAMCAWDVHPTRAWMWAAGAALGAGLVGWIMAFFLKRSRLTPVREAQAKILP